MSSMESTILPSVGKRSLNFKFALSIIIVLCLLAGTAVHSNIAYAAESYKIVYHLNGGTQAKGQMKTIKKGKTLKVSALKKPTRKGYSFKGWYSNKKLTKKAKSIKGSSKKSKRTLYAKWSPKKYKITYKLNKGKLTGSYAKTYKYGKGVKLPTPQRKGYAFEGWFKDKKFTKPVARIGKSTTGNKTFYAKWTIMKYSITFNPNGGELPNSVPTSFTVKKALQLPTPMKPGYSFIGWYTNKALTKPIDSIAKGTTGDKTLYAKWVKRFLVAHRGYHVEAPQNSVESYRAAAEIGFENVETDVRFTKDGVPVLNHDSSIAAYEIVYDDFSGSEESEEPAKAMQTSGSEVSWVISEHTYDEIQNLIVAKIPSGPNGSNIATFEEFLQVCEECGLAPTVDLKEGTKAQIAELQGMLEAHGLSDTARWGSSSLDRLNYVLAVNPTANIGYYSGSLSKSKITKAKKLENGRNSVSVSTSAAHITDSLIRECKSQHIPLGLYGVADEIEAASYDNYICKFTIDRVSGGSIPEII